ncbi:MAG: LysR family transcriptional regulator [Gammaproteobacteria bacterium HGW-Gammaproteobacteria-14]|nr:MAG: LysR family transcriptional regulator [Gammaproteobacteria bacterium HGW-Gammaproteobacteria-14]
MLGLRHLETLDAIREAGSLVEASERLHVTQSALSHQLRDIEGRLGVSLLNRRTRPVRFTVAGERLLALADQVLPLMRQGLRDIRALAEGQSGRLHLAIECHACFQWLMPALDVFREQWPQVELDLSAAFAFAPVPALLRGDLDMVVSSDPVEHEAVLWQPLFSHELVLAVSRNSSLAEREFVEPADLVEETLITYPVERDRLDIFTAFLQPANIEPAAQRKTELTPMMIQLVAAGRGVAALPNWAISEYLDHGLIRSLSLGERGVWRTLYIGIRAEEAEVPYLKEFIQTARQQSMAGLEGIRGA